MKFKEIELTRGYKTKVDEDDYDELNKYSWQVGFNKGKPVAVRSAYKQKPKKIYMSRQIMGFPVGKQVDHINRDKLDNRKSNLRICTNAENCRNRGKQRDNKYGFKGVTKNYKRWQAVITLNYKNIFLGNFGTKEEAYAAYCKAAKKYHGKFASLT